MILGVGTRWSDFTTASRSLFADDAAFVNLNVASVDAYKHAGLPLLADARVGLEALPRRCRARRSRRRSTTGTRSSRRRTRRATTRPRRRRCIGVVNRVSGPRDVVVCAAGSMPGDLHKLWRTRDPKGYHVEYGYSTMGYEIAGGLGIKMAAPDREVFVLVGDGSYLMMAQEIVTAVAEGIKLTIVLVQNHGYASIGALSETVGSQRFGTKYRYRDTDDLLPVDLAANAASLGARALNATTIDEFEAALRDAVASDVTTVVQVHTDPLISAPSSRGLVGRPVAEVAALESTRAARDTYEQAKQGQRRHLAGAQRIETTA